jgi:hypothetical protein
MKRWIAAAAAALGVLAAGFTPAAAQEWRGEQLALL